MTNRAYATTIEILYTFHLDIKRDSIYKLCLWMPKEQNCLKFLACSKDEI